MSLFGSRFVRKDTWLLCYMFVLRHTYLVIALSLSLSLSHWNPKCTAFVLLSRFCVCDEVRSLCTCTGAGLLDLILPYFYTVCSQILGPTVALSQVVACPVFRSNSLAWSNIARAKRWWRPWNSDPAFSMRCPVLFVRDSEPLHRKWHTTFYLPSSWKVHADGSHRTWSRWSQGLRAGVLLHTGLRWVWSKAWGLYVQTATAYHGHHAGRDLAFDRF